MNFAQAANNEATHTFTENGARAKNTTGSKLLDLFGSIGSLRGAEQTRIERLFADAYAESPLLATKILFYSRDVRGGLGERDTFRKLLRYCAFHHPEALQFNIGLISVYGRYDDMYALVDTPMEADMWKHMKLQFELDLDAMRQKQPCSLLSKWIKTPDASSKATRQLGIRTAIALGYKVYDFKRMLRKLRKYIDVVERKMSSNHWKYIDYEGVPSRAMMLYRKAFERHDTERYMRYLTSVEKGEAKVNASVLYPYDLVEKYLGAYDNRNYIDEDRLVEAQWKALPDYVGREANAIVIADTSGSMVGRPLNSALALAIYFAERNKGAYHNLWMTFSERPSFQQLSGETLAQKLSSMNKAHWGFNTDLHRAFQLILDTAIRNRVPQQEMVKSLIIISDMQIDAATENKSWSFYDSMARKFEQHGYTIPNIVFWNVDSRSDVFHADGTRKGVQLCSGQSASTFKMLMNSVGMTPIEAMLMVLNGERYQAVHVKGEQATRWEPAATADPQTRYERYLAKKRSHETGDNQ